MFAKDSIETTAALYNRFARMASCLQSAILLVIRLTWGWQLVESGQGHLSHLKETTDAFIGWGVPFPEASVYISAMTEQVGGLFIMFGFAARLISVPMIFNFLVAYATASRKTLVQLAAGPNRLEGYDAFINDSAFTVLILSLLILAFGPGKVSIDHLIRSRILKYGHVVAIRKSE